jgi:hypothetical protein
MVETCQLAHHSQLVNFTQVVFHASLIFGTGHTEPFGTGNTVPSGDTIKSGALIGINPSITTHKVATINAASRTLFDCFAEFHHHISQ